jgi:drug/metabolite transporter (DMT)-like permease
MCGGEGLSIWPLLALILVSAMWGSHAVVGQSVESHFNPLSLAVWRFTLGAIFYLPLLGRFRQIFHLPGKRLGQLALTALCWSVIYPLLWYQALLFLSPVQSLLLVNTSPILASLISWLVLKERLALRDWIGILVSFLGVVILVMGGWSHTSSLVGVLVALAAALAFALYSVSSRSLFQALPLFDVLLATSVFGAVLLWIVALCTGQVLQVATSVANLPGRSWVELLYIVIIVGVVAYMLYGYGLKRLPAGISSSITFYPQVIFAAVIQWIWFGMTPSPLTWVSAVLILGGTALMTRGKRKRTDTRSSSMEQV